MVLLNLNSAMPNLARSRKRTCTLSPSRMKQRELLDGIPFSVTVYLMSHSNPSTFAASAVDRLRRKNFGGQLSPGTRLAEAAQAKRLGVSRVPVWEAFAALKRDGRIEFTRTGRTVVKTLTPQDFEKRFALRLLLEPAAAREKLMHEHILGWLEWLPMVEVEI